jgi:hypothetical protein
VSIWTPCRFRFGTGDTFLSAAQSKLSGSYIHRFSGCFGHSRRHDQVVMLSPLVGRAGLDVSEPEAVRLRLIGVSCRSAVYPDKA